MIFVNTKTIEEYDEVVRWALSKGKIWINGSTSINKRQWETYMECTCLAIRDHSISYCHRGYVSSIYRENIIDMEQFLKATAENIGKFYGLR